MSNQPRMMSRTMFSPSEEEVISKFLISCWKKKLRVPHILLYDALKKHVDKFPRKSRAKDNRPSHFWRQRFFERHPLVREAYDNYKSSPHRDYEVVSDHLLNAFVTDLASADKPYYEEGVMNSAVGKAGNAFSGKVKKRTSVKSSETLKKAKSLSAKRLSVGSLYKEKVEKSPEKLSKHKRSKTTSLSSMSSAAGTSAKPAQQRESLAGRKKMITGLKLSPALFHSKKAVKSDQEPNADQTTSASPLPVANVKQASLPVPLPRKRNEVPAHAVPLEPIKFEVGANIEAMDGYRWYKAKIMKVDNDKKQVLIHYNGWRKRFDTYFSMSSAMLRGQTQTDKKSELKKFVVGDDVLSQWSDGKFYPGTVIGVRETGSYVVMFYDGLKKLVRPNLLKPLTSEIEKNAAMNEAQRTYFMPYDQTVTGAPLLGAASPDETSRRYRTSANDRERRVAARKASIGDGSGSKLARAGRKRKRAQTLDPSVDQLPSPSSEYQFQAKQARLDKITGTLLDKVVPTEDTASTTTTSTSLATSTSAAVSTSFSLLKQKSFDERLYQSDESDAPLVIDESENPSKPLPKESVPVLETVSPLALPGSIQVIDENLHKLADAALTHRALAAGAESQKDSDTGIQRDEASQSFSQLIKLTNKQSPTDEVKILSFEQKINIALTKVLEKDYTVIETAAELDLKVEEVHDAVLQHPGVIFGISDPRFLISSEEDVIINWIHDVSDLGWGVKNIHIAQKVKSFLTADAYMVLFSNENPLNYPATPWITDFLSRHPELFPGREKPMSRFRFDREGFEEWLGRWLAVLRSKAIKTNAVFYCDETVWDINARLPEVKFNHQSVELDSTHTNGNRITTISCIGATGVALPPYYLFPDNEKCAKIDKELYSDNIVFSTRGALNSHFFLHWMKNVFIRGIPPHKRPAALLVDAQLESLDYEIIKFANDNDIILYRFLPQGAHFIQHPDQKLFGRLRMQWKKTVFSQFLKDNSGETVSIQKLVSSYNEEFYRIASSSTIKMCFELTKLYVPQPESAEESPKEKKKRRKNSKVHVAAPDTTGDNEMKKKPLRRSKKVEEMLVAVPTAPDSNTPTPSILKSQSPKTIASSPAITKTPRPRGRPRLNKDTAQKPVRGRPKLIRDTTPKDTTPKEVKADAPGQSKQVVDTSQPYVPPVLKSKYKKGETVLAKWTDCKLYTATVMKKVGKDNYKIRYFDGLTKVVSTDFLRAWDAKSVSSIKSPPNSGPNSTPTLPQPSTAVIDSTAEKNERLRRGILTTARKPTSRHIGNRIGTRKTAEPVGQDLSSIKQEQKDYQAGDNVLCKWTDRRLYPATIIKQIPKERYLVKYYDQRRKVVHHSWLWPSTTTTNFTFPIQKQVKATHPRRGFGKRGRRGGSSARGRLPGAASLPTPFSEQATPFEEKTTPQLKQSLPPDMEQKSKRISISISEPDDTQASSSITMASSSAADKPVSSLRSRRSIAKQESTEEPNSSNIASKTQQSEAKVAPEEDESEKTEPEFVKGDNVLARWTDCRSYPATVLKYTTKGSYQVRYYDGMVRMLKRDMLKKWDPNIAPIYKPRRRLKKQDRIESTLSQSTDDKPTAEQAKGVEKPSLTSAPTLALTPAADKPVPTDLGTSKTQTSKPMKVSLTYEAYYTKLTQESELNKFKCKVPGCSKVFRHESVLKQHHKHYHMQRYKLRDQEAAPSVKRKASRDELPPAKRRVSADVAFQPPKSPLSPPAIQPTPDRPTRSKGGKPPLEVIQQNTEILMTSPDAAKDETPDKPTSPTKKRRKKSDPPQPLSQPAPINSSSSIPSEESRSIEVVNEDVIRCACGEEEDAGFMLQCDTCLTWQHARCEGIASPGEEEKEDSLPEYVCSVCKDPPGVRESQRYRYNNDFLTKGILPRGLPRGGVSEIELKQEKHFQKLMLATNRLMEELTKMQESLQGIRMKINIANPNHTHPLLHLWKDAGVTDPLDLIHSLTEVVNIGVDRNQTPSANNSEMKATKDSEHENVDLTDFADKTKYPDVAVANTIDSLLTAVVHSMAMFQSPLKVEQDSPGADADGNVVKSIVDELLSSACSVTVRSELEETVSSIPETTRPGNLSSEEMLTGDVQVTTNEAVPIDSHPKVDSSNPDDDDLSYFQEDLSKSDDKTRCADTDRTISSQVSRSPHGTSPSLSTESLDHPVMSDACESPDEEHLSQLNQQEKLLEQRSPALISSSTAITDSLQSNIDPSETLQSNVAPSETLQSNVVPSETLQSNVAPSETLQSNVGPSETLQSNVAPSETSSGIVEAPLNQEIPHPTSHDNPPSTSKEESSEQDSCGKETDAILRLLNAELHEKQPQSHQEQQTYDSGFQGSSVESTNDPSQCELQEASSCQGASKYGGQTSDKLVSEQTLMDIESESASTAVLQTDKDGECSTTDKQLDLEQKIPGSSLAEGNSDLQAESPAPNGTSQLTAQQKATETTSNAPAFIESDSDLDKRSLFTNTSESSKESVKQEALNISSDGAIEKTLDEIASLTTDHSSTGSNKTTEHPKADVASSQVVESPEEMDTNEGEAVAEEVKTQDQTSVVTDKVSTKDDEDKWDLWAPIKIIKPVDGGSSGRHRTKSEDTQEELILRSRGNLLQHIHRLEMALSERLTQLENYVITVEAAFDQLLGSSMTSSGMSYSYDNRLGELQSDLSSLHKDVDAVEKLFLS